MSIKRCNWVTKDPIYIKYHDEEWGFPVYDDQKLFEFLILETFQAGLSWITILRKRENFRNAFDQFDPIKVARFNEHKISLLMQDAGIVRNQAKIRAAVSNAKAVIQLQNEFGSFSRYIWSFVNEIPIQNEFTSIDELPSKTDLAERISIDLKKRGFKFVGPTVIYSFMQATGMVNDHTKDCFRHQRFYQ